MSYTPNVWVDHVNSGNIYNINENSDGTKEIVYAGEVLQKGTPMSAENFNHMEEGIETADQTASAALTAVNVLTPKIEDMEDNIKTADNKASAALSGVNTANITISEIKNSDIPDLQEAVQNNADTIGVHENKIAVLTNNVSGIQTGLSATAERVSDVENDLSSLQSTVQTNATNIGVHENEISVLNSNVSALQTGLSATSSSLSNTVTRVSDVEDELSSHEHSWSEITSKPSTFTPSSHSHAWSSITSKPSSFTPASHTHTWDDMSNKTVDVKPYASSNITFVNRTASVFGDVGIMHISATKTGAWTASSTSGFNVCFLSDSSYAPANTVVTTGVINGTTPCKIVLASNGYVTLYPFENYVSGQSIEFTIVWNVNAIWY